MAVNITSFYWLLASDVDVDTHIEIAIEKREHIKKYDTADQDHDHSSSDLNFPKMRLEPLEKGAELIQAKSEQQERNPQAE